MVWGISIYRTNCAILTSYIRADPRMCRQFSRVCCRVWIFHSDDREKEHGLTCDQAQLYHRSYVFLCRRSLVFVSPFSRERSTNETKIEPDRRLNQSSFYALLCCVNRKGEFFRVENFSNFALWMLKYLLALVVCVNLCVRYVKNLFTLVSS